MTPPVQAQEPSPHSGQNGHQNGYQNGYQSGYQNGQAAPSPLQLIPLEALNSAQEAESEDFDLLAVVAVLRRRVLVLLGVAIAVTTTAWTRTLLETPVFESGFQILVEPVAANNTLPGLVSPREGFAQGTGLDYATQIQVLRSPEIIEPIVQEIQVEYPNLSYGTLVGNLLIYRVGETKILAVTYRDSDPLKVQKVLEYLAQGYLNYSLQEQQTSLSQGISFVEEQLPQTQERVGSLQQTLQNLQQEYQLIDPSIRSTELTSQLNNISDQLSQLQQHLIEAQNQYQDLQGVPGAAMVLRQDGLYQTQLGNLKTIETQLALELAHAKENSLEVQALQRQRQNLLPLLTQEAGEALDAELTGITQQLQSLQSQRGELLSAQQVLQAQIAQLPALNRIFVSLQRELDIATSSLDRLLAAREALQLESAQKEIPWQLLVTPQLPGAPVSPNIPRNLGIGAMIGVALGIGTAFLIDRLDNVFHSLEELRDVSKYPILGLIPYNQIIKLRQPAQLSTPLVATSGTGTLTEDRELPLEDREGRETRESREDREDREDRGRSKPPGSGVRLPGIQQTKRHSYSYQGQPFTEAFRSLAINLCFLSSDQPLRSLVISSALPGDGKSTVSLHLAQAAAAMGQRVLLVDADLRRPQIHRALSLFNGQGLSNLIASDLNSQDVIQPSGLEENLWIIPAGQLPPDPSRLLSSEKMKRLIQDLSTAFDFVIYDTPPLLGLSDASLLAAQADGIVVVVGMGRTHRSALKQALESLKTSRKAVLGLVANALDQKVTGGSYHYYHYRYSKYYQATAAPLSL